MRTAKAVAILGVLMMAGVQAQSTGPSTSQLGKAHFPSSGSGPAQEHFLRGLAALHSFWYEEARAAFVESTNADPEFMMGYWGEAMTHNHPIWHQQNAEAGRQAMQRIKNTEKLTARERAYINALRVLYGEEDKLVRDQAYAAAMEKIYREYPDDGEAASFYALALLGTVRSGDKGFRRQAQAGALALELYQKNPDHPGAAHYIIHAFDDPEHAVLALPAARRYAEIAPEAHHARHMPSHIFLQLGMWPEAAAANESSWAVSDAWVQRKKLPIRQRDYHSLSWLLYIYLQQGRHAQAEGLLGPIRQALSAFPNDAAMSRTYAMMAATLVVETQQWELAAKLFPPAGAGSPAGAEGTPAHCAQIASDEKGTGKYTGRQQSLPLFVRGLAAAMKGLDTRKHLADMRALRKQLSNAGDSYRAQTLEIMELEIAATTRAAKGQYRDAIEDMKRAGALEEALSPPSGPPDTIKPAHELYGEILLRAGRPQEAARQFATALLRQPNRARALLGAARAAAQSGDRPAAAAAYSKLAQMWSRADTAFPERKEAQSSSTSVGAP